MSANLSQFSFAYDDGFTRTIRRVSSAVKSDEKLAVLMIRLVHVERLIASVGHYVAHEIINSFHREIFTIARKNDMVERIGQQRFVLVLSEQQNTGHIRLAAQKISRIAERASGRYPKSYGLRAVIGVAMCPEQGTNGQELLRLTEIATMDARGGDGLVSFFKQDCAQEIFESWDLEIKLAEALESGDLELFYQPKQELTTGRVLGAEALMRWYHEELGSISPQVFIDVAESTGQIVELTQFALQRACRQLSIWRNHIPGFNVAVNVTPSIIQTTEIVHLIESAAAIWGVSFDGLTVEVTENALLEDRDTSHQVLNDIRALGARVSIDDFGTGYSSLAYLKDLPANELKIDRTFVAGMLSDPVDLKIVKHCISMAESFGMTVVAEGVEDGETLNLLSSLGCDFAQGYHICKPLYKTDLEAWMLERQSVGTG